MQTSSSRTLIGWKSGQTTYGTEWRERGYGLWCDGTFKYKEHPREGWELQSNASPNYHHPIFQLFRGNFIFKTT
jgi:hypothetical protein